MPILIRKSAPRLRLHFGTGVLGISIRGRSIRDTSDPNVTYTYEDGAGEGVEAKYLRQSSVTYPGPSTPNRRAIYHNYESVGG